MKFRGQISQGLVQPLSILPEGTYKIGDEVTELLGIRKWEVEERVTSSGTIIGEFPDGIPKTCLNMPFLCLKKWINVLKK